MWIGTEYDLELIEEEEENDDDVSSGCADIVIFIFSACTLMVAIEPPICCFQSRALAIFDGVVNTFSNFFEHIVPVAIIIVVNV